MDSDNFFWKVTALIMLLLAIFAVLIAIRCSETLTCVSMYEDNGIRYCVSEVEL